jgi:rRNA maturation protein Rpf1
VIGFTTGRQTTQRLNSLLKELAYATPKASVVRRGKSSLADLGRRLAEEDVEYAVMLCRWQGGPGRMDFFKLDATNLTQVAPSAVLSSVKLRREFALQGKHTAQAVTFAPEVSSATRKFADHLSQLFDLPESMNPTSSESSASFHVGETSRRFITVSLTSPPRVREVGPRLVVSRLIWDLHG